MTSIKSQKNCFTESKITKFFFQLFGSGKYWFLDISILKNTVAAIWREKKVDPCYLETKKCSSQLFGARKKIMTSIKSQKNSFTAIKSTKNVSQLFRIGKNWFLAISSLTNTVAAIWREKKVDPCYLDSKKYSSQQLGAREKIMTCI